MWWIAIYDSKNIHIYYSERDEKAHRDPRDTTTIIGPYPSRNEAIGTLHALWQEGSI